MKQLMKYLKPHWVMVLILVLAHLVRGISTLVIPLFTSNLVDVGIQNQGIEYAVPLQMTPEDYQQLENVLLPEEAAVLHEVYQTDAKGNYELPSQAKQDSQQMAELAQVFRAPLAFLQQVHNEEDLTLEAQEASQLAQLRKTVVGQLESLGESYVDSLAIRTVIDQVDRSGGELSGSQRSYLISNGTKMMGYALLTVILSVLVFYLAARIGSSVGKSLRQAVFDKVMSFSQAEIGRFSKASLLTRTTNDIQLIQLILTITLRAVIYMPILVIGGIIQVVQVERSMVWISILSFVLILLLVVVLFRVTMPKFRILQRLFDRVNQVMREILSGIQVIRAFGRQKYEAERFDESIRDLRDVHLFTDRLMSVMLPMMLLLANLISVLIVWVAGHRIGDGLMQVGQMMAFISFSMTIMFSFLNFSMMSMQLPRAMTALQRVSDVLDTENTIIEPAQAVQLDQARGEVRFNDVDFRFPGADECVLEDISFTARPGETTAIIGSTGSGKSTILNLIMRFFDVTHGSITIDGVDLRNLDSSDLRNLIGFVPQHAVLFSGTIRSNIGYGLDTMSDEVMERAARIAHAEEFIEDKDAGYDARIAQGGSNVSGGQKQRLSIARAIAKDPLIYLFDDSFSALDYRTDASLRQVLKEEVSEATLIIVAQRVSTILDADQIIVLDDGRIDGIGTHQELMQKSPVYREIAQSQLSSEELANYGEEDSDESTN